MLNVAPQKERIPDHLRAMAEQDDKSAASGKTGEQSSVGVGCAPGEERAGSKAAKEELSAVKQLATDITRERSTASFSRPPRRSRSRR